MRLREKLTSLTLVLIILVVIIIALAGSVSAGGISIDAGLTPAENRWIFRSQVRFMQRDNDPTPAQREMKAYMFPVVVAYGVRSDLTVMVRQAFKRSEMVMGGQSSSDDGFTDLLVAGKYRLVRVNKPAYTFGIAPTLGLEIPSGSHDFTSNTWDLRLGSYASARIGPWGIDLNTTYVWNGMAKAGGADRDPGDEFSIEGALARQFSFGPDADIALAPVIESTFLRLSSDSNEGTVIANTGESVFLLSPGIKLTWSSFFLEGLIQFPLWQEQNGLQTERGTSFLIGVRLLS